LAGRAGFPEQRNPKSPGKNASVACTANQEDTCKSDQDTALQQEHGRFGRHGFSSVGGKSAAGVFVP
jgi:hypothetical protein